MGCSAASMSLPVNFEEGGTFRGEPGKQIVLIFRNQKLGERSEAQKNS